MHRSLVVALILLGCSSDEGGEDATSFTATTVATTAETGTTVDDPSASASSTAGTSATSTSTSTSTTSPTSTTDATADSSSGDAGCSTSNDCADDEVCAGNGLDGACIDALNCEYMIRILELTGVTCEDGVGDAEVSWMMWRGERLVFESQIDSCPLGWLDDAAPYTPTDQTVTWRFYEHDTLADDELFYFCFEADCGPIPVTYLHDGGWTGTVDNDLYYLDIEILPIC